LISTTIAMGTSSSSLPGSVTLQVVKGEGQGKSTLKKEFKTVPVLPLNSSKSQNEQSSVPLQSPFDITMLIHRELHATRAAVFDKFSTMANLRLLSTSDMAGPLKEIKITATARNKLQVEAGAEDNEYDCFVVPVCSLGLLNYPGSIGHDVET
jgi:hypothetical protein